MIGRMMGQFALEFRKRLAQKARRFDFEKLRESKFNCLQERVYKM
jgi:hypothetical protein